MITDEDKVKIAAILAEIERQRFIRDQAEAEMKACWARLVPYEYKCEHPNKYGTSCMGERGWKCPDCKASY